MRFELLYNPALFCERLAYKIWERRRLKRLRHTVAQTLSTGHIESLELLEAARPLGINVIYDVGANVGTWAMLAKAVIPDVSVEAFEPLQNLHPEFKRNVSTLAGIRLHPVALGSKSGEAALHVMSLADASSLLPLADASRSQFGVEEIEQVPIQVRRMDEYRIERNLPLPDLIKLDVQGYELEVLKGATECLRAAKAVVVEVSFIEYYHKQCLFHSVVEFLAGFGLYLSVLGVNTPRGSALQHCDVLFLRRMK